MPEAKIYWNAYGKMVVQHEGYDPVELNARRPDMDVAETYALMQRIQRRNVQRAVAKPWRYPWDCYAFMPRKSTLVMDADLTLNEYVSFGKFEINVKSLFDLVVSEICEYMTKYDEKPTAILVGTDMLPKIGGGDAPDFPIRLNTFGITTILTPEATGIVAVKI